MKNLLIIFTLLVSTVFLSSPCYAEPDSERVFALYRNNHLDPSIRVHVATFDAQNRDFNEWYCKKAIKYFRADAKSRGSDARYWCEVGYVKK